MLLKAQRDFNSIPQVQTSPRLDPYKEKLEHDISDRIMNQKFKEFDKMLALNKRHDEQILETKQRDVQAGIQSRRDLNEQLPENFAVKQVYICLAVCQQNDEILRSVDCLRLVWNTEFLAAIV